MTLHLWRYDDELVYYHLCGDEVGAVEGGADGYVIFDDII